jgi:hypothetical protein
MIMDFSKQYLDGLVVLWKQRVVLKLEEIP